MSTYSTYKAIYIPLVSQCMTTEERKLYYYKKSHRPENKKVNDKPNDTGYGTRRRTRPWDKCWFSNRYDIIFLTVEEAIRQHPDYMLWCYNNLAIKWSVHTVKLFEAIKSFEAIDNRPKRMTIADLMAIK
jgi:hypothetical protein